jgi:GWxTD domain-containing protein
MKEDEFRAIKDADHKRQKALFDQFWKRLDKTPQTAYNEVMAEYYKRVDYAFTNFSTIGQHNGIKTDRGKAYILYGPPSSISRDLSPSASPKETWMYTSLRKKLIFVDEKRNGNYRILTSEDLLAQ